MPTGCVVEPFKGDNGYVTQLVSYATALCIVLHATPTSQDEGLVNLVEGSGQLSTCNGVAPCLTVMSNHDCKHVPLYMCKMRNLHAARSE